MRLYAIENYCPDIKHEPKSRQSNCVADKVHYKKGATILAAPFFSHPYKHRTNVSQHDRLSLHRFQPLNAKDTCPLADRLC